jgi:hypothetical protein
VPAKYRFGQKLVSQKLGLNFSKGLVENNNPSTFFAGNAPQLNKNYNDNLNLPVKDAFPKMEANLGDDSLQDTATASLPNKKEAHTS